MFSLLAKYVKVS